MQNVSTCLCYDTQAEEAVAFYVSLFPNSRIIEKTYYFEGTPRPTDSVLTVRFVLDGCEYLALNAGPQFRFTPAMSLIAYCDTQEQIDRLWRQLAEGGQEGQCGWLTDRFGLSWQIAPRIVMEMYEGPDRAAAQRAFTAMLGMTRLDIAALRRAYDGG